MDALRVGSRGHKVELLQRLINRANVKDRIKPAAGLVGLKPLNEDGAFGPLTGDAVSAFKWRKNLKPNDPVAGAGTWDKLGLVTEKEHAIPLIGQPTAMTCWAAAAMMILKNSSPASGGAQIDPTGGLTPDAKNVGLFARALGWRLLNHSPGVIELVDLVVKSPVWIGGFGGSFRHAVVLSGVYSDRDPAGGGTMFRIHDPWPPGVGSIYGSFADPVTMRATDGSRTKVALEMVIVPR